jgi:hypothetical protein
VRPGAGPACQSRAAAPATGQEIAALAGVDIDASEHDVPAAGLIRTAGEAVEDLDMWAIGYARAAGATETYRGTGRWCHAPGGALPPGSWPIDPAVDPGGGEVRIRMPGSGVLMDYASQCERDRSVRLAKARQALAERRCFLPGWDALREDEQEIAAVEARNWLRAGIAEGLIPRCPLHEDCEAGQCS